MSSLEDYLTDEEEEWESLTSMVNNRMAEQNAVMYLLDEDQDDQLEIDHRTLPRAPRKK